MREEFFIKLAMMVYKKEMLKNMPLLTRGKPESVYKRARGIYKRELGRLDEFGQYDVMKLNLAFGVMIYSLYESCEVKPDVSELRRFCRNVVLTPKLSRAFLGSMDMTSEKGIQNQVMNAQKSRNATHPYTWQYEVTERGDRRFRAEFSRCGIYDFFKSKGLEGLVPAICILDFSYCQVQGHIFLRKETIATGGSICDCTYISKDIATEDEIREYENDMANEALRGGVGLEVEK